MSRTTGAPGTAQGFGYRIAYIAPELIREALGDRDLPFVPDPVHPAGPSARRVAALLADIDEPLGDLARAGMAATFSDALIDLAGLPACDRTGTDLRAVRLVRAYLAAHPREQILASELEQIAGTDRYTIARHFRRAFGTSPDRYRTMRRLALDRAAIENGTPLARAAADAGFSDQSHMTRQFTKAYGMTPARWAAAVRAGRRCSERAIAGACRFCRLAEADLALGGSVCPTIFGPVHERRVPPYRRSSPHPQGEPPRA